jgi:hypothetical protein
MWIIGINEMKKTENIMLSEQFKNLLNNIKEKGKIPNTQIAWTSKWHFIVMNDRLVDNLRYCYVYYSNKTTMIMLVLCCEHWYINPRDWKEKWLLLLRRYSYKLLTISGGRTNYCNLICLYKQDKKKHNMQIVQAVNQKLL